MKLVIRKEDKIQGIKKYSALSILSVPRSKMTLPDPKLSIIRKRADDLQLKGPVRIAFGKFLCPGQVFYKNQLQKFPHYIPTHQQYDTKEVNRLLKFLKKEKKGKSDRPVPSILLAVQAELEGKKSYYVQFHDAFSKFMYILINKFN